VIGRGVLSVVDHVMRTRRILLATLVFIVIGCATDNDSDDAAHATDQSSDSTAPALPAYHRMPDETFDVPLATRVIRRIVLDEPATREQLEAVVRAEFADAESISGFAHHQNPTAVGVYVFSTEDRARADEGLWVAMLYTSDTSGPDPAIEISAERLTSAWAPPEERFGLSEAKRVEVFHAIVRADDRARADAHHLHANDPSREARSAQTMRAKYRGEVAREYGISMDQVYEIITESLNKGWPSPIEQTEE
jgi:hypothetical protein